MDSSYLGLSSDADQHVPELASFSDNSDEFPSQNLRETIGLVSRRLEFDNEERLPRQQSVPALSSNEWGIPEGHPAIQRSAFSLATLPNHPTNAYLRQQNLHDRHPTPLLSVFLNIPSMNIAPIDLSTAPLDLRVNVTPQSDDNVFDVQPATTVNIENVAEYYETSSDDDSDDDISITSGEYVLEHSTVCEPDMNATYNANPIEMNFDGEFPTSQKQGTVLEADYREHSENAFKLDIVETEIDVVTLKEATTVATTKSRPTPAVCTRKPPSGKKKKASTANMNLTYAVRKTPPRKSQTNAVPIGHHDDTVTFSSSDLTDITPLEVEPKTKQINVGAPASCFVTPHEASIGEAIFLEDDDNLSWAVKKALKREITQSPLKLTLTRTLSSNAAKKLLIPSLETWPVMLTDEATVSDPDAPCQAAVCDESRRIVVGSEGYSEESTIFGDASQVIPIATGTDAVVKSHPETPDITIRPRPKVIQESPCPTFPVSVVGKSSTPQDKLTSANANCPTPMKADTPRRHLLTPKMSPRTQLLKKRVREAQDSDSVLNTGFSFHPDEPTNYGKKKKSLFKLLKRQLLCAKNTSIVSLGQSINQGHSLPPNPMLLPPSSSKENFLSTLRNANPLMKCSNTANQSSACPTTLFTTFTDSATSLTSWCRHIRDVTRIDPVTGQMGRIKEESVSPVVEPKVEVQPFDDHIVPVYFNAATSKPSTEDKQEVKYKTVGVTVKSETFAPSTSTQSLPVPPATRTNTSTGTNTATGTNRTGGNQFKKPRRRARLAASKSAPALAASSSNGQPQIKLEIKDGAKGNSAPLLCSTPRPPPQNGQEPKHYQQQEQHPQPQQQQPPPQPQQPPPQPQQPPPQPQRQRRRKDNSDSDDSDGDVSQELADNRLNLIYAIGQKTAEWLASFMSDKDMKIHYLQCAQQPNRLVLVRLCKRCKIKIHWPDDKSSLFRLKKTRKSRTPTDSDIRYLVRKIRRVKHSRIL